MLSRLFKKKAAPVASAPVFHVDQSVLQRRMHDAITRGSGRKAQQKALRADETADEAIIGGAVQPGGSRSPAAAAAAAAQAAVEAKDPLLDAMERLSALARETGAAEAGAYADEDVTSEAEAFAMPEDVPAPAVHDDEPEAVETGDVAEAVAADADDPLPVDELEDSPEPVVDAEEQEFAAPAGDDEAVAAIADDVEPVLVDADAEEPEAIDPGVVTAATDEADGEDLAEQGIADPAQGSIEPLETIYLSRETLDSDDPYDVIQETINILNYLLFDAHYTIDEVPADAFRAYTVDYYTALVREGGHALFFSDIKGQADTWAAIGEGFAGLGISQWQALWQSICDFAESHGEAFEEISSGDGFEKHARLLGEFDHAFARLEAQKPLVPAIAEWLKSRPGVKVVPGDTIESIIVGLGEHPALAARRLEMRRAQREKKMDDPIDRIGVLVCDDAGLSFERWVTVIENYQAGGNTYAKGRVMLTDEGSAVMVRNPDGSFTLYDHEKGTAISTLVPDFDVEDID